MKSSKQNEKKLKKKGQPKLTKMFKGYERYTRKRPG